MKQILILEPDENLARTLSEAILGLGEYALTVATTLREACLLVARQPHDLALLSIEDLLPGRRALQSLQPDLAVAAVAPDEAYVAHRFADSDAGKLRGIVLLSNLDEGLRRVLGIEEKGPVPDTNDILVDEAIAHGATAHSAAGEDTVDDARPDFSAGDTLVALGPPSAVEDRLAAALDSVAGNEKIVGSILTTSNAVLSKSGALSDEEVQAIVLRVSATWHEDDTALLQFIRPAERATDLLLFSRPALASQLLTLAAAPDCNVSRLRRAADELAARLAALTGTEMAAPEETPVVTSHAVRPEAAESVSYALVWQPRRPLPAALQVAVKRGLQSVATANNCTLRHQEVTAGLVHIVATCPGSRSSGWVAQLFKKGVEAQIQEQFGIPAQLWRAGFYAAEGERPLNQVELKLFAGAGAGD